MNSKIILCKNIKIDKEYVNVMNYTEEQLLNLITSNGHLVAQSDTYSFIRASENRISTGFTYAEVLQSNYMAFQNPDYSGKWFFAWIEDAIYKGDNNTIIEFKIDAWSTWFNNLTLGNSFVVREHVSDDTPGKHLIPEDVDTGEYKVLTHIRDAYNAERISSPKPEISQYYVVVASTIDLASLNNSYCGVYNGIPTGYRYFIYAIDWNDPHGYPPLQNLYNDLENLASMPGGKGLDAILNMFLAPRWLVKDIYETTQQELNTRLPEVVELSVTPISQLDGYTPKNKKLLQYPFCYIRNSNCQGQEVILKQEFWEKLEESRPAIQGGITLPAGDMVFVMCGCLTQGCSVRCLPEGYNGDGDAVDVGINLGKFPQVCWSSDAFTNWLSENGVNIAMAGAGSLVGAATGNVAVASSGLSKGLDLMRSGIDALLTPPQVNGNTNNGDIMMSMDENCFHIYKMSIRYDYAKRIDDYLTRYGYKVNELKTPNITSRQNFNYIQISSDSVFGYGEVPEKYMDEINKIVRNGTTIWHNHANIGNYSVTNNIVS